MPDRTPRSFTDRENAPARQSATSGHRGDRVARERKARKEAERLLEAKSRELFDAKRDLEIQLDRVSAVLDGAPYSILTIEADLSIGDSVSASLPALLRTSRASLARLPAVELLAEVLEIGPDAANVMRATLEAAINEDRLTWDLNHQHLPNEATVRTGERRIVEILWTPLIHEQSGLVSAVLASLRDVTAERALTAKLVECDRSHAELMRALGDLLKWPRSSVVAFFAEAKPRIEALRAVFAEDATDCSSVLIDVHSLKAAARTLQLSELVNTLHQLEAALLAPSSTDQSTYSSEALALWRAAEQAYARLSRARDQVRLGEDQEKTTRVGALIGLSLNDAREVLARSGAALRVSFEDYVGSISLRAAPALSAAFSHIVPNVVDHSLGPALSSGALTAPHLEVEVRQITEPSKGIVVTLRDNGRGFDLDKIQRRASELGLPLDPNDPLSVVFEPGFSTAQSVTTRSGRGVGMAAVRRAIETAGGDIQLGQRTGGGCEIVLRLPD